MLKPLTLPDLMGALILHASCGGCAVRWLGAPAYLAQETEIDRDIAFAAGWSVHTPMMERYLGWDAHRRDEFQRTLAVLLEQAVRQYHVFILCVLAPFSVEQLTAALGLDDTSPFRMARRRGYTFMLDYCGDWIDVDADWSA